MIELSRNALTSAATASGAASRFTGYVCCARVYVQLTERVSAKSRKLAEAYGFRITTRPNHCNAIYVGYDNATGLEYGRATAIAAALRANGVSAYEDADED